MTKHYTIGGSTMLRTIKCSKWFGMSRGLPEPADNIHADVGTLNHLAMDAYYAEGQEFDDMIGVIKYNGHVLQECHIADLLKPAVAMVESAVVAFDFTKALFEQTHEYNADMGGTADILALSRDKKTVGIIDYKFGSHRVDVVENTQLYSYAFFASENSKASAFFAKAERIVFIIIQPKVSKTYTMFETTLEKLADFKAKALKAESQLFDERIRSAEKGGWCWYCRAKNICSTYNKDDLLRNKNEVAKLKLVLDNKPGTLFNR